MALLQQHLFRVSYAGTAGSYGSRHPEAEGVRVYDGFVLRYFCKGLGMGEELWDYYWVAHVYDRCWKMEEFMHFLGQLTLERQI